MTSALSQVKALGRCVITFNSQDLGIAEDVVATLLKRTHLITCEAGGPAPIAAKEGGIGIELEATFLEYDYDVFMKIFADEFTKVVGTATTGTKVTAGATVTAEDASGASLSVVPTDTDLAGYSLAIHKAVVVECDPKFSWGGEKKLQEAFTVKFVGIFDFTRSSGDQLFAFGTPAASVA